MLARRLLLGSVLVPDEALGIKAEEMSDAGFGALSLGMFISDLVRKGFLLFMGHVQASWSRAERETPAHDAELLEVQRHRERCV